MENLPGDVAHDSKIAGRRSTPMGSKSWTLLLIGELGNIVSFRFTKPLAVTITASVATILAFGIFAMFSYHAMRTENKTLKKDLEKGSINLVAANKAMERALVRLMVLEGKPDEKKNESASGQKPPVQISRIVKPPPPPSRDTKQMLSKAVKPVAETQPGQPVETSEAGEPVSPERLSIEKLEIWRDPETFSVTFQFGLKNIHPEGKRIKGYTFIVLKPEEGSQEPLRSSPWTPLKDGKPTLFKRGQYFSIARFKFVRGIFPDMERIELFKTATVYVYSGTGSLLVEQVYDLDKIFRS